MYYDRIPSTEEALYISRAQQKIAELTAALTEEYSRNDIDEYKPQLCIELQYSIEVLTSTDLTWSEDEIGMMIGYYTIQAGLSSYGYIEINYASIGGGGAGSEVWATIPQLTAVDEASVARDDALQVALDAEIIARIAGDAALQAQIDLLGAGGALTIEITSQINLGAIIVGQVFPVGTLLQDIWVLALGTPAVITGFTFDTYQAVVEAGVPLVISQFTWDIEGAPVNLKLTDSEGIISNQAVSGSSYTPGTPVNYPLAAPGRVTWTLTGDNIEPVTIEVDAWQPSFYGKEATANDNAVTVTEAKILAGTSYIQDTTSQVATTVDTGNTEQGFIAVPKIQTTGDYTKWKEYGANQSEIAVGDFIRPAVDVLVDGVTYSVYRWGYRSPIVSTLTLYR
jgi:hypothetical protein